jgi:hypothetical protein
MAKNRRLPAGALCLTVALLAVSACEHHGDDASITRKKACDAAAKELGIEVSVYDVNSLNAPKSTDPAGFTCRLTDTANNVVTFFVPDGGAPTLVTG